MLKSKKDTFFQDISTDVENGNNINWQRFKKLKNVKQEDTKLDAFDMINFCNFFKDLYGKPTLSQERIAEFVKCSDSEMPSEKSCDEFLDREITMEEIKECIRASKRGKAVSEDLISNEMLKASGHDLLCGIRNLFNQCLTHGTYPWNTSVVTPLHKKGSVYDPNNYRAIAVASNLGKLFSSILLQRLIVFRNDTVNQLGFCKNSQTADHILTLSTCVEKYVKQSKGKLYCCFVDYSKAFDTVCREALLYKLWKMGIKNRFFNCLEHMYNNSSAKVKLLGKLSDIIEIHCGTEQGHPLSPELFKCFIHDLSEQLNNLTTGNVPELSGKKISHLLWADDLVLMALDGDTLQNLLNILLEYCNQWGLSVNISKTAVMIFNRSSRVLNESHNFKLGNICIPSAKEYTYLGITFSLNGALSRAQNLLRQKALRSFFALRKTVDFNPHGGGLAKSHQI